jgi:hypothetical protein
MSLFSIPTYPGATSYAVQYSDPISGDPNAANPLGPWNDVPGSPFTSPSNIVDSGGSQNLRLYRVAPTITVNGSPYTLPYYQPFSVAMVEPGQYEVNLYDPQITTMLPAFRAYIGDNGIAQTSSTEINLDSGAGTGLLQPDGSTTVFNLSDIPDASPAIVLENSVTVVLNGATKVLGTDYWVRWDCGQIVFATAPAADAAIAISYTEVQYTNRMLNAALANAVDRVGTVGISGYGLSYDNNVCLLNAPLGNTGLRSIIFMLAAKILNGAKIWLKAQQAREYKSGDFSMNTMPARFLEGMGGQFKLDTEDVKSAVYKYNRANTHSVSYAEFDSFLNTNGLLPAWSAVWLWGYSGFSGYI